MSAPAVREQQDLCDRDSHGLQTLVQTQGGVRARSAPGGSHARSSIRALGPTGSVLGRTRSEGTPILWVPCRSARSTDFRRTAPAPKWPQRVGRGRSLALTCRRRLNRRRRCQEHQAGQTDRRPALGQSTSCRTVRRVTQQWFVQAPSLDPATLAAYRQLASEYDSNEHATTRALEAASGLAWARAPRLPVAPQTVLELGTGTGALTEHVLNDYPSASLIATDPVSEMLAIARRRLARFRERIEWIEEDAQATLRTYRASLLIAGLADPYLDAALLAQLPGALAPRGHVFVTVPSARWAKIERDGRLALPLDLTRFVLRNGTSVSARSFTYDHDALARGLEQAGLTLIEAGTTSQTVSAGRQPAEVAWALAQRTPER